MKETKLEVVYLPISDIKPYENNAKLHPKEQIEQIKKSIVEFGMNDPIAICGEGNIIVEGHGRLIACQELGLETVPVIRLDHLTDEERRAYTLAHNKLTMNTGFDLELLQKEMSDISLDMTELGFDLDETIPEVQDEEIEVQEPDPEQEPISKRGEIYQLGEHRLMCGDSTNPDDVEKLTGGGAFRHGAD